MKRVFQFVLCAGILLAPIALLAQSGEAEQPLGDLARDLRRSKIKTPPAQVVVDNDNFTRVMESAESRRMSTLSLGFNLNALPPKPTTPDVTCNLAFNAQSVSLADGFLLPLKSAAPSASAAAPAPPAPETVPIPAAELSKLEGPAAIVGDSLQVSVYNGTSWELREITVSLTILHKPAKVIALSGEGRVVPVSAVQIVAKRSDKAILYRLKGSAAPASTTLFKDSLGMTLDPDQEWHWAIVEAKGVPAAQ